jgi:hypothetical protein
MEQTNIMKDVAASVIEAPVAFTIDILPRNRWHRWAQENKYTAKYFPKVKEYSIKPITYGNMMRISGIMESIDLKAIQYESVTKGAQSIIHKEGMQIAKAIAYAIHNKRSEPPPSLINDILWSLNSGELLYLALVVNKQLGLKSFLTTIVLMSGVSVLESEKKPDEKS